MSGEPARRVKERADDSADVVTRLSEVTDKSGVRSANLILAEDHFVAGHLLLVVEYLVGVPPPHGAPTGWSL
jgi:hypothetical protein